MKEDFPRWYNDLVREANFAEAGGARGSMIIKPYGYALWEKIKENFDDAFKAQGCQNAYFPLLLPLSYFNKEAQHIEGFAKESAIVTCHRLKASADKKGLIPDPDAFLDEPLVIRPTSEAIIWEAFGRWISSYRDLPLAINQWANVVRWELRTRPFLRSTEFLWQEGHTAHASKEEAMERSKQMLETYKKIIREILAIPLISGEKTEHERFAGAEITHTMEALMQDGKALQLGTSHFLGQNFSRAFSVRFSTQKGDLEHPWGTSWGITTRLIGALIMVHGDDQGVRLPPRIAPIQVVIVPIPRGTTSWEALIKKANEVKSALTLRNIRVHIDERSTHQPGWKFNEYEKKGVPIRLAIGPRDLNQNTLEMVRRDQKEKKNIPEREAIEQIPNILEEMQNALYQRALAYQKKETHSVETWDAFKAQIKKGGFVLAHWDGTTASEKAIQETTKATIRCIPEGIEKEEGKCIYTGKRSKRRVLFARAY